MKREEIINNAAIQFATHFIDTDETDFYGKSIQVVDLDRAEHRGFVHGAKWADKNPKSPWLNAEVDLPHKHDSLLIRHLPYDSKLTKPVLTLVDDGSYQVCDMFINEEGKWEWSYNGTVLYWMPIPKLEED